MEGFIREVCDGPGVLGSADAVPGLCHTNSIVGMLLRMEFRHGHTFT